MTAESGQANSEKRSIDCTFIFWEKRLTFLVMKIILMAAAVLAGTAVAANAQDSTKATAKLEPKSKSNVTGTIEFTRVGDNVQVTGDIQNLSPGKHGFHIHEKGDCSAADAASAGGHFNPTQKHHGGPVAPARPSGDHAHNER